jgi:hypothetical protein
MPTDDISSYFQLAIRLLLDSVSYSNALPEWFESLTVDYLKREETVRESARRYLGGERPKAPFEIAVPKRSGGVNSWVIPSINDQIILQACISAIAQDVEQRCIDSSRVFSCLYNRNPNRLAFLEDQVEAWTRFQQETQARCTSDNCVLQFDIACAYQSMDIDRVGRFLKRLPIEGTAVKLLEILLAVFSGGNAGLPFLNDSVFFLGNAYLSEVDRLVSRHTANFIRYVDDYKIFGNSRRNLEALLERIRSELRDELGFELSDAKVRVGTADEYLEALSKLKYAEIRVNEYIDVAVVPSVFRAEDMHTMVDKSLGSPEEYLHQGFGRLQMASIRRMRVQWLAASTQDRGDDELKLTPRSEFASIVSRNTQLIRRISQSINTYSREPRALWRLVWLLYLTRDVVLDEIPDEAVSTELTETLQTVNQTTELPMVARLWAAQMPGYPAIERSPAEVEDLHALDYLERGRQCYGGEMR